MIERLLAMLSAVVMLSTCQALHPVILVPGNGGNQLEARLTSAYQPRSFFCGSWNPPVKDPDGWFRLWFDPSVLFAPFTRCFAERMTLYYDRLVDDYRNAPGVETRAPAFGSIESLLYLDPHLRHITSYMAPLVEALEKIGYISGQTLFGAPYDFRYGLAAADHPSKVGTQFLNDLKTLIIDAYESNGGKPAIIVSHSLGGLFVLQLLTRNSPSWRQKYVKHFVALAAPWGGTVEGMLTFASGNTLRVPLVDPLIVREEQRSSESNLWLLPSPMTFRDKQPLVTAMGSSYTANDMEKFLEDIGFAQGVYPYKTRIFPLVTQKVDLLGVLVTCIVGTNVKTPKRVDYGTEGFENKPKIVYGDGDGTVNSVSLLGLKKFWDKSENQTVKVIRLSGISHVAILRDQVALDRIIGEVKDINSPIASSII